MVKILSDISRTFSEYLIIPNLSKKKHVVSNVSLKTPIAKFGKNEKPLMSMNIPFISASMQSVSGVDMAIALARLGGLASIYCSQPIDKQAEKVKRVKQYKAGFVDSDSNVKPDTKLKEVIALIKRTGHSTVAVTHDGSQKGQFLGILTEKDFWEYEDDIEKPVSRYMTPVEKVVFGNVGISLHEASSMLHKRKKDCLPILDKQGNLNSLVFKKDFFDYQNNPNEMLDNKKRLQVAAAINTHDYKDRVPALIDAGADVLIMDASDGYSEFQKETALWVRERYGNSIVIGGGNIISSD
ncbi:MAG: IMP dehydrogenase, partial [Chitinispirillia bacterium]